MADDSLSPLRKVLWLVVTCAGLAFLLQAADLWALQALSANGKPASREAAAFPQPEDGVPCLGTASGPGTYLPVVEEPADQIATPPASSTVPNFAIVGDGAELGRLARAVVAKVMPLVFGRRLHDVVYVDFAEVVKRLGGELRWKPGAAQAVAITDDHVIRLRAGSKQADVDLAPVQLSEAPEETNGKLMIAVGTLGQMLDAEPRWSPRQRIFDLDLGGSSLRVVALEDIFQLEVSRSQRRLQVYVLGDPVKSYPMCVGRGNNTPVGHFHIQNRAMWPPWRAYWGEYIPGGSRRNPLGARWLGTTARGHERGWIVGMHGTNQPSSIGKRISGGYMRLYNHDAIELYNNIPIGTSVWMHEEPISLPSAG